MKLSCPKKTSLGETGCLSNLLFTGCSSIQVFNSPLLLNTVSRDTFGTLPFTVQYLCDLRGAMPRHWSLSISHP